MSSANALTAMITSACSTSTSSLRISFIISSNILCLFSSTDSSVFGGNGSASGVTVDDGSVVIRTGTGSVAYIDLYCEVSNAHRVRVQSPAHSQYAGNITVKLPNVTGTIATVGTATADVLLIKDSGGSTVKTIKGAGNSAL